MIAFMCSDPAHTNNIQESGISSPPPRPAPPRPTMPRPARYYFPNSFPPARPSRVRSRPSPRPWERHRWWGFLCDWQLMFFLKVTATRGYSRWLRVIFYPLVLFCPVDVRFFYIFYQAQKIGNQCRYLKYSLMLSFLPSFVYTPRSSLQFTTIWSVSVFFSINQRKGKVNVYVWSAN